MSDFETDIPAIETQDTPACDLLSGTDCVNPPPGAVFYPIFTTNIQKVATPGPSSNQCSWEMGGRFIPGTTNTFGGNSTSEFGATPVALAYQAPPPAYSVLVYEDFRRILSSNPCQMNVSTAAAALRYSQ